MSSSRDQSRSSPETVRSSPALAQWSACGIVTLMTDFGLQDPYVAMMKGVLLTSARDATIVDLTHAVPAQDVRAAAWIWKHSLAYFPPGTVHVAVVDPGVGSKRGLLVAFDRDQVLIAPDNGLVSPCLSAAAEVFELDEARFARSHTSRTFHGRDILAPAAAHLARGGSPAECIRARRDEWVELDLPRPLRRESGDVVGEIVLRDRFGNLISNLTSQDLERDPAADLAGWHVWAANQAIPIRGTYAEAASGELLALVDSYGALEIAVRDGSAADVLRLGPGDAITARRFR